jgi:RNase P subunit RPR2
MGNSNFLYGLSDELRLLADKLGEWSEVSCPKCGHFGRVRGVEDVASLLQDLATDLDNRRPGRPKKDEWARRDDPKRKRTKELVREEEERLRRETGKTRVKTAAVRNVARKQHISVDAVWKRIL